MEAMLIAFIVNAVAPFLLEKGKFAKFFPFMQPIAPVLNSVTSFVVALATQIGVAYQFDPAAHTLLISGLDPLAILRALVGAGVGFLVQKFVYKVAVKESF
jgi:hypothetical protein